MVESSLPHGWRVERLGVVASTQDALRAELEAGVDVHGLVIRAEAQTKGKGRQEREWSSGPGGSYQTVGVRDVDGRLRSGRVPIAVAVGVAETFLARRFSLALKWPNDLYLVPSALPQGPVEKLPGKVGGILCQHLRGHLLIGVGINVRNEVPGGVGALTKLTAEEVSELVLEGVGSALTEVLADRQLPARFGRFDLLAGLAIKVVEGQQRIEGVAAGVDDEGCLLVKSASGSRKTCSGRIVEIDATAV